MYLSIFHKNIHHQILDNLLPVCYPPITITRYTKHLASFFANVIDNWSVSADQSSGIQSSDLQVAKATETISKSFTMAHKMGLTEIELKTGSYNSVTETNNGTGNITRVTSNEEVTASSSFSSTSPYHIPMQKNASNLYYAVVKTGVNSTKFNSEEGPNQWAAEYSATVFLSGYISHHDAYSKRAGSTTYSGSFSYSGTFLTFTALFSGTYTIECWGASGGDASYYSGDLAGRGGYVSGQIDLDMDDTFYIYVGGTGTRTYKYEGFVGYGGYNGGGTCSNTGCGGGGATDVRLVQDDLKTRIIVAGGGGGENLYGTSGTPYYLGSSQGSKGGNAGGLTGLVFYGREGSGSVSNYGGTQTSGGTRVTSSASAIGSNGSFGIGGNGYYGAGGGGWYGGSGGSNTPRGTIGEIAGGGGSSFISGYAGCRAVDSSTGSVLSVSYMTIGGKQFIFSNMSMIDGGSNMNKPDGTGNETGHLGQGYCRITGQQSQ